jgi:hypothetical protein
MDHLSLIQLIEKYREAEDVVEASYYRVQIEDRIEAIQEITQDAPSSWVWKDMKPVIEGEPIKIKKSKADIVYDEDGFAIK